MESGVFGRTYPGQQRLDSQPCLNPNRIGGGEGRWLSHNNTAKSLFDTDNSHDKYLLIQFSFKKNIFDQYIGDI